MKNVVRVILLLIVLYWISDQLHVNGLFALLCWIVLVVVFIRWLIRLSNAGSKPATTSPVTTRSAAVKPKAGNSKAWQYWVVGIIILLVVLRNTLTVMSINFFLFIDYLVGISTQVSPVVMWAVLGAFTGLVYGSFIAWRKYRLDMKANLLPAGLFLLFILLMFLVNRPL